MQISGFRIQVLRTPVERQAAANEPAPGRPEGTDSSDVAYLSWAMLDAEGETPAVEWLGRAVAEGSYWIPTPQISRSLVNDHLFIRA